MKQLKYAILFSFVTFTVKIMPSAIFLPDKTIKSLQAMATYETMTSCRIIVEPFDQNTKRNITVTKALSYETIQNNFFDFIKKEQDQEIIKLLTSNHAILLTDHCPFANSLYNLLNANMKQIAIEFDSRIPIKNQLTILIKITKHKQRVSTLNFLIQILADPNHPFVIGNQMSPEIQKELHELAVS